MIVNLFSPDGSRDNLYLSNYATIQLQDELARLDGRGRRHASSASATTACGSGSTRRSWPSRNLTAGDVVAAIAAAERPGRRRPDRPAAGAPRAGLPVHDEHAGPADRRRAVRRHHRQDRRRRAGSSACATSPGSNSAPRTTTRPARSTASPRWPCRSTSCPAPTPWRPPSAVQAKMEELKQRFPEGVDYAIVYDTTPFITRIDPRSLQDAPRRRDPGGHRGAGVPAELAVGDHPAGRRAGGRSSARSPSWPRWASA